MTTDTAQRNWMRDFTEQQVQDVKDRSYFTKQSAQNIQKHTKARNTIKVWQLRK